MGLLQDKYLEWVQNNRVVHERQYSRASTRQYGRASKIKYSRASQDDTEGMSGVYILNFPSFSEKRIRNKVPESKFKKGKVKEV